ncbi:MAG TPA: hypothetical protein VHU14_07880 [Solirubrobacterales bacterium]|nr:hypothetical protein [Solirubrobacterales bacterium]
MTTVFEAMATAVSAGVVLGGFTMGIAGLALGWSKREIGYRALTDGYMGGIAGVVFALLDVVLRYAG